MHLGTAALHQKHHQHQHLLQLARHSPAVECLDVAPFIAPTDELADLAGADSQAIVVPPGSVAQARAPLPAAFKMMCHHHWHKIGTERTTADRKLEGDARTLGVAR